MPNPKDPASLVDVAMTIANRPLPAPPSNEIPGPRPRTPYEVPGGPSPLDGSRLDAKASPRGAK
jgi:hypothetical protein